MRKVAAGGWNDPLDPYDGLGAGDAGFIPGCGDPLYDPVKRFCVLGFPPGGGKNTAGSLWKTPEKTGTNEENMQGGDAVGGMSPFQSACTALAATIGTGNIAGVATALLSGGPGAIFWMWVSAFLGMATAYGETVLGIRYRKRDRSGGWVAGPMLYMNGALAAGGPGSFTPGSARRPPLVWAAWSRPMPFPRPLSSLFPCRRSSSGAFWCF